MYEQFFNFMGLREDPFHVSPDPRFFYPSAAHESALAELLFGIETRQGILVLTGEAGTGKTSILNQILDWLHRNGRSTAYIFHTHLEPIGLLKFILSEFGVPCQSKSKSELVSTLHHWLLQRHAAHDRPVLIIDEAQGLPVQTLDELRLLLNVETPRGKLLQIILAGQPELENKLNSSSLRQLRQRVMFHSRLPLLTQKETAAYISSRLATAGCTGSALFPDAAIQNIYASSRGVPRVVNLLCEHALISAYAERQHTVSPEIIQRIAADFDLLDNPLAVTDGDIRPRSVRLAPFPVIEEAASPAPPIHPPVAAPKTPATAEKIPPVVSAPPAARSAELRRYWRSRSSRMVVSARNAAATVRNTWHAFTRTIAHSARSIRLSLFPVPERKQRTPQPNPRFTANWWVQIAFDIFEDPVAAVQQHSEPAPIADPLPAVPPPPVESSKQRRSRRPRPVVPAFVLNSFAAVHRACHICIRAGGNYAWTVYYSFVRDCRFFFRGLTPPTPALETASSSGRANTKPSADRNVFAPVVNWLRQPFPLRNGSSNRSAARSSRRS